MCESNEHDTGQKECTEIRETHSYNYRNVEATEKGKCLQYELVSRRLFVLSWIRYGKNNTLKYHIMVERMNMATTMQTSLQNARTLHRSNTRVYYIYALSISYSPLSNGDRMQSLEYHRPICCYKLYLAMNMTRSIKVIAEKHRLLMYVVRRCLVSRHILIKLTSKLVVELGIVRSTSLFPFLNALRYVVKY